MRPVVLEEDHEQLAVLLRDAGVDVVATASPTDVPDAEILLASPPLAASVISGMPSLRWIQSTWAGVDSLLGTGVPPGIVLTRLEGVFGPQMREFVFGHILGHTQRVADSERATRWVESPPALIAGSRMGVLGTGSIGKAIAETAVHFGVDVIGCSRTGRQAGPFRQVFPVDRRLEFAQGLDHLVATLPATSETCGLIDAELIERLAPGATLVNVGRGSTLDVGAVVDALGTGRLSRAVLDVLPIEPLPEGHAWWSVSGLIITSHTAAWSRPEDVVRFFVSNLERHRRGEPMEGVVDLVAGY